jgi:hypothetical protein
MPTSQALRIDRLIRNLNEAANMLANEPPLNRRKTREANDLDDLRAICRKTALAITWYLGDGKVES